uniref:Uncharacterized protein n=1 Tax=Thermogladius calderae TaxID=1200300 RepID=A0A7J3Y091_9CREN
MLEKALPLVLIVLVVAELAYGAVFTYYSAKITASPVPPPIVLGAGVSPYCVSMTRTARTAIAYTDFETYPVPGWRSDGGTWSLTTGYKGYGLQGTDNNRGIGSASQYYYNTALSSYTSLWVTVKTKLVSGSGWQGIVLINSGLNSVFTSEIDTYYGNYLEIWYYSRGTGWMLENYVQIQNYNPASWYVIVVSYSVTTTSTSINAYLYDTSGNLVASVSWSGRYYFTPTYLGVEVDDVTAVFDDFEVSTGDPRFVTVNNTIPGYTVSIGDNLGNIVAAITASSSTTQLSVVTDVVVGTGVDGNITVKYPDGTICLVYKPASGDTILGGDIYTITQGSLVASFGANYTSASVRATIWVSNGNSTGIIFLSASNNDSSKPYYARLILDSSTSTVSGLTCNVTLYTSTATSTPITVSSGQIVSSATSFIQIPAGGSANLSFTGYASSTGLTMRLNMLLEYCSQPGEQGVCVYYPVSLTLNS